MESLNLLTIGLLGGGAVLAVVGFLVAVTLRRVVPTNEVHIVQSSKETKSYGKGTGHGNTYFEWPASLPFLGITKTVMPTSNFDVDLKGYEAYDEGRLPFVVDVKAFFRIADSNEAAQKVANFEELLNQLTAIVQGAVRTVLASNSIEEIMQGRSKFGNEFTAEVKEQLKNWGVETVKNIELMDIRDHANSKVIANIMEKKKSLIESQSRIEVAKNQRDAELSEIAAKQETDLKAQAALEAVGLRTTQQEQNVALAQQAQAQVVKEQEKLTKEKEMNVLQVESVRKAEIAKAVALVKAEEDKQKALIAAEAEKQKTATISAGQLEATKNLAEGIAAEGKAKADAERAMLSAPVEAQITLAKEIGSNDSYQKYLLGVEQIKANQAVGTAQADALKAAQIKVIANSGNASEGLNSIGDIFSSKGGTQVGAMLEGLANTEQGQALLNAVGLAKTEEKTATPSPAVTTAKKNSANGSALNGSAR
jgi:flotillin